MTVLVLYQDIQLNVLYSFLSYSNINIDHVFKVYFLRMDFTLFLKYKCKIDRSVICTNIESTNQNQLFFSCL